MAIDFGFSVKGGNVMTKANVRAKNAQNIQVDDTDIRNDDQKVVEPKVKSTTTKSAPKSHSGSKSDSGTTSQSDTQQKTTTRLAGSCLLEGPAEMYLYWNYKVGMWMGPKEDIFAALQAGNGFIKVKKVWVKDGKFHHFLSEDEIERYCP